MDAQWVGIGIQIVVALVGFIGAVISITSVVNGKFAELDKKLNESIATTKGEFNARLEMFEQTQQNKIDRVYVRFDDHKKACDDKFVSRDLCNVMHDTTASQLIEVKVAIAELSKKVDHWMELYNGGKQ